MARTTFLSDDLLHRLMAVGQVDIVVGIPTMNNAETVAATLGAVHDGLTLRFPRARTVVIAADGGSNDGTPEIVAATAHPGARGGNNWLRTRHQIAAPYRGRPGRSGALRQIFSAVDLLQARAVAVIDPEVTSLTPGWIGSLLDPVVTQAIEVVTPMYGRHPLEGLLVTQLIRPLLRAAYGYEVDEPLVGEFGCSGAYAAHCLAQDIWDRGPIRDAIEPWLAAAAFVGGYRAAQVYLGPRVTAPPRPPQPGIAELFPMVVQALFASLDTHAAWWLPRTGAEPLPRIGPEPPPPGGVPPVDVSRLGATFRDDVRQLGPVLESILPGETYTAVSVLADGDRVDYPDQLWVRTVHDFLVAYHAGVMDRAHIAQALLPLYLGRAASFAQAARDDAAAAARAIEQLAARFEEDKPYLRDRWSRTP